MRTVHLIIGTRPEAIKMAPVYRALQQRNDLRVRLVSTGQHRELLTQTLDAIGLPVDYNLNVMRPGQSLSGLTAQLLTGLEKLFIEDEPDVILGHGDTSTCYATALSAFYHSIPFFHVEAGLRSFRLDSPFPEEFNRQCVSRMASFHFAPSTQAEAHLRAEGVRAEDIAVVGSTGHDAIRLVAQQGAVLPPALVSRLAKFSRHALFTLHRREGGAASLRHIMRAIDEAAGQHPETLFVFPVHPNPQVKQLAQELFCDRPNIHLSEPLDYPSFLTLLNSSALVLTDSGGVQEEAAYFGRRTLVLRELSERADGFDGRTEVVGIEGEKIIRRVAESLANVPTAETPQTRAEYSASENVARIVGERCAL